MKSQSLNFSLYQDAAARGPSSNFLTFTADNTAEAQKKITDVHTTLLSCVYDLQTLKSRHTDIEDITGNIESKVATLTQELSYFAEVVEKLNFLFPSQGSSTVTAGSQEALPTVTLPSASI
jgi:hypothetical protein